MCFCPGGSRGCENVPICLSFLLCFAWASARECQTAKGLDSEYYWW